VAYKFGLIAMIAGLVGVPLGSQLAQRLRSRFPRIDPLICAVGLLVSSPIIFAASLFASVNGTACFLLIFFGQVFLNLNWSIVADMLLVSTHRIFFITFVTDLPISCARFITNCSVCIQGVPGGTCQTSRECSLC
jgi:hypothetical protein